MQNTPISPAERVRLSKQFDELTGGTKPKDIAEALKYELAKEKFISARGVKSEPVPYEYKGPHFKPGTLMDDISKYRDERLDRAKAIQNATWVNEGKTAAPARGLFQSTPIPKPPVVQAPAPAAAPQATGMPAPAQKPPVMPPQQGSAGMSASMSMGSGGGAAVNPAMSSAYLKQMQDMVEKQLVGPQRDAAEAQLETMKRAQAEYNAATGDGESALDFYRKSMEGIKRPNRKDAQLSDEDRNDMLMRFGLGMLKNNRKGFGEALGAAGTDAIDFGDRAKERQFTDALEVYRDAMTRLNTEVNLSQKDKDALRERATTSYNQAKEIAGAEAAVALSGTAGAKANIDAIQDAFKEANANARNSQNNATSSNNARIAASAASVKGIPTDGLTAEGYARLSTQARKQAEDIRGMLPKKDDPRYNALATQADQLEKQANMYWTASTRAAGGR